MTFGSTLRCSTPRRRGLALLALCALTVSACKQLEAPAGSEAGDQVDSSSTDEQASAGESGQASTTEESASGTEGDGAAPAVTPSDAVAQVNGISIPLAEFQRQAFDTQSYHVEQGGIDPNTEEGQQKLLFFRRQVLRDMIDQALIEQAATSMGIAVSDEELATETKKLIEEVGGQAAFARKLAETNTSKDAWMAMERAAMLGRRVLDEVTADLADTAEFVHARQIFCQSEADCQQALDRLAAGEDFGDLAAEVSEDGSTKDRGGDLDWITRGSLLSPELEDVVFGLQVGERSAVVRSDLGYHIVEVLDRDQARKLNEEQQFALKEKRVLEWLGEQRAAAEIVIYIEDLKDLMAEGNSGEG